MRFFKPATRDLPGPPAGSDPQAVGDVTYVGTERQDRYTYETHRAGSRSAAVAFLRARECRRELYYIIVETPQGNVGKDMIALFDEPTGEVIELVARPPLPGPQPSSTCCVRCGYPVRPDEPPDLPAATASYTRFFTHDDVGEMARSGYGFQCADCANLSCAACYQADLRTFAAGEPLPCWFCQGDTRVFVR